MDIYSIPLYYISFNKNLSLEAELHKIGFTNVNHFKAIKGAKLNPYTLRQNGLLTARAYTDLISGRSQDSGLSGLGAVGCTMSHYSLWKKCCDSNLPYMIIIEEDLILKIKTIDEQIIRDILKKHNSIFVGTEVTKKDGNTHFIGLQFYIVSKNACKQLVDNAFPIDIQTDWYISDLDTFGKINVEGYLTSSQKFHISSVQSLCMRCLLPKNIWVYILVSFIIILIIIYFYNNTRQCHISLETLLKSKDSD